MSDILLDAENVVLGYELPDRVVEIIEQLAKQLEEAQERLAEIERVGSKPIAAIDKCVDDGGTCGVGGYCDKCPHTRHERSSPVPPAAQAVADDVDLWKFCRDALKRGAEIESQFSQQGYEPFIAELEYAAKKEEKRLRALLAAQRKPVDGSSYLRPAVARFASRMEDVLRKNDHKGGWERIDSAWLYTRLLEEARELETAIRYGGNRNTKHDAAILVANEAADVANFAMMIAENALLAAQQQKEINDV